MTCLSLEGLQDCTELVARLCIVVNFLLEILEDPGVDHCGLVKVRHGDVVVVGCDVEGVVYFGWLGVVGLDGCPHIGFWGKEKFDWDVNERQPAFTD